MKHIESLKKISGLKQKKVVVRLDLNVPIVDGKVRDDFRIAKAIATLSYLQKKGAKIIAMSHLGEEGETLAPVAKVLAKKIKGVRFVKAVVGEEVLKKIEAMKSGDILLLENVRTEEGEKKNDPLFAKVLASYGDVYVNDAFSASHRSHASIVGIPKYIPGYMGLQFTQEIQQLEKVLTPRHPFLFILGGAKYSTKLPMIKKYAKKADTLFVGGALAHNFFKARGKEIGLSKYDADEVIAPLYLKAKNIFTPIDVITDTKRVISVDNVLPTEKIFDLGPASLALLSEKMKGVKMILLNGPLGNYEADFSKGTEGLLKLIAKSKAFSVIGGGDTVALIGKLKLMNSFGFVSTGGGAMLDFLSSGTLPGLQALIRKAKKKK